MIKPIIIGLLALASANESFADNSAMDCLKTWPAENKLYFKNICDYNIYVIYCGTDKKFSGKYCGDYTGSGGKKGTYYTHSFNLKAGNERDKYKPGNIHFGACKGMTGFGRSFSDTPDGKYTCEDPKRLYDK